jgi:hypothetical protein
LKGICSNVPTTGFEISALLHYSDLGNQALRFSPAVVAMLNLCTFSNNRDLRINQINQHTFSTNRDLQKSTRYGHAETL